jgi:hypothetical protein
VTAEDDTVPLGTAVPPPAIHAPEFAAKFKTTVPPLPLDWLTVTVYEVDEFAVTLVTDQPLDVPDTEKSFVSIPVTPSSNVTLKFSDAALLSVVAGVIVAEGSVSISAGAEIRASATLVPNAGAPPSRCKNHRLIVGSTIKLPPCEQSQTTMSWFAPVRTLIREMKPDRA